MPNAMSYPPLAIRPLLLLPPVEPAHRLPTASQPLPGGSGNEQLEQTSSASPIDPRPRPPLAARCRWRSYEAELTAVSTSRLAPIPEQISDAQAATLPTAGLTALRALEVAGLLLAKQVLITGATGGVGRIAVQLAQASGATVSAL